MAKKKKITARITPKTVAKSSTEKKVEVQPKITPEVVETRAKSPIEKVVDQRTHAMEERLAKQKKYHFMIPLGIGEKKGATIEVCINGYVRSYQKGIMLEVPETVFNLLADHYNVTDKAGKEWEVSRSPETEAALS